MTTLQWMRFLVVVLWVNLELTESKMMVRHFGPPPDMGPGPHGKYDWVIKVMQSIPNRCPNAKTECTLTCVNSGTVDNGTCQCDCDPNQNWSGKNCSQCALYCENGGILDYDTCQCDCDQNWSGKNCSQCALSCENGGKLDNDTCQCDCDQNWSGKNCHYKHEDCQSYYEAGNEVSGVYTIYPQPDVYPDGLKVYCYMLPSYRIGYIVIQRREDGSENFTRSWNEYKDGFGSLMSDHWIGNDVLHNLTREGEWMIRVALTDTDGTKGTIYVKPFSIMSSNDNYALSIGTESIYGGSDIGTQPLQSVDGQQFSTYDRDNDKDPESNCAGLLQGGWWFNRCTGGNPTSDTLNGEYPSGIRWNTWDGKKIVKSKMAIIRCGNGVFYYNGLYC